MDSASFEGLLAWATATCDKLRRAIGTVVVGQGHGHRGDALGAGCWRSSAARGAPGLARRCWCAPSPIASISPSRASSSPRSDAERRDRHDGADARAFGGRGTDRRFALHRGPIFGHVVLADEINRATPKTQSALLEAMQERAVTIAGQRHALEEPFFRSGDREPYRDGRDLSAAGGPARSVSLEGAGRVPTEDEMVAVIARTTGQASAGPRGVLERAEVLRLQSLCRDVVVSEAVMRYAARLVQATDPRPLRPFRWRRRGSVTARGCGELSRSCSRPRRARYSTAARRPPSPMCSRWPNPP